jgi:hypothetical protein
MEVGHMIRRQRRTPSCRRDFPVSLFQNCRNTVLQRLKAEGKRVYALGAPVKGSTLMNFRGIGRISSPAPPK